MKASEFITEIGHADAIPNLNIGNRQNIIVGHFDNTDIWLLDDGNTLVYNIQSNNNIDAYVAVKKIPVNQRYSIVRVSNISHIPGAITMILAFLITEMKFKLIVDSDEDLTDLGLSWLVKLIKSGGRGFKISDNYGNLPNINNIKKEWETARKTGIAGNTAILIENKNIRIRKNERDISPLILPSYRFLHSKELY